MTLKILFEFCQVFYFPSYRSVYFRIFSGSPQRSNCFAIFFQAEGMPSIAGAELMRQKAEV
jgi:hypothetical protein